MSTILGLSLFELTVAVLFVSETLEVWKHGSIFEEPRAMIEAGYFGNPQGFFLRLISCPFCLGVWLSGAVVLLLAIRPLLYPLLQFAINLLIVTGATARASNILHDLVRPWSRTPGSTAAEENTKIT